MNQYVANILADSVSIKGIRIITFEVTAPRIILAEINTYCMWARNWQSSRAIPTKILLRRVWSDPFTPSGFAKNQRGMQAGVVLSPFHATLARAAWRSGARGAVLTSWLLNKLGVHKQWANRPLEPYTWCTGIITATEWANMLHQRCSPLAQPEFNTLAEMIRRAIHESIPKVVGYKQAHLPMIYEQDRAQFDTTDLMKIAVGRCARVSYLNHHGLRDPKADIKKADDLLRDGHWSPFEHVALPMMDEKRFYAKFRGWKSFRAHQKDENILEYDGISAFYRQN
jgi:hypothetical protein